MNRTATLREESKKRYDSVVGYFMLSIVSFLTFVGLTYVLVHNIRGLMDIILISSAALLLITSIVIFVLFVFEKIEYDQLARELFQEEIVDRISQRSTSTKKERVDKK